MQRVFAVICIVFVSVAAYSAEPSISGTVADCLGAMISGANVALVENGKDVATSLTDTTGQFHFDIQHTGRYSVRAEAKTFATSTSEELYAQPGHNVDISLTLSPSVVSQNIVVTATGIATPEAQMGTSVSVIEAAELNTRINLQQSLNNEVGAQVVQTGQ